MNTSAGNEQAIASDMAQTAAGSRMGERSQTFAPWLNPDAAAIVEFKDIRKSFGDFTAVDGVSLRIFPGEFFALLGPSGCGKTTLLRMLAGFETPTSGKILLDGQDISPMPANKRPINMMFQSYALFPHLSVEANIAFGLKRAGRSADEIRTRTAEMLQLVQMSRFADRKPDQLSGGQRQRVALARSLARNPKLLLLDEPLGALDAKLREQTQFELVNIQEKLGTTFIIVTHDQEEAMTVATRIGLMDHGRLAQVDTPADIYEEPATRFVADFIGNVNLLAGKAGNTTGHGQDSLVEFHFIGGDAAHQVFVARSSEAISPGTQCHLAVRPEKILITRGVPDQAQNVIEGRVHDIAYVGSISTYHVRLTDGTIVKAQEANRRRIANREITWEDRVFLSWTAGAGILLTK